MRDATMSSTMVVYRSRIVMRAPSATPWQADTLFGHFCWWFVRRYGEESLSALFERYHNRCPDFILSEGFPAGYLPKPAWIPSSPNVADMPKEKQLESLKQRKQLKAAAWYSLDDFNAVRKGEERRPVTLRDIREMRSMNQIDRRTFTAGSEGGELYDFEEHHGWRGQGGTLLSSVDVYWRLRPEAVEEVSQFLENLRVTGYGKRKSIGYGAISKIEFEPFNGFIDVPNANGFVTLSRFVPAENDPTDGVWNLAVKYGKLGEEFATSGQPFKRPLIQLEVGSVFRASPVPDVCGRLVRNVATDERIIHYGYGFPVSIRLNGE